MGVQRRRDMLGRQTQARRDMLYGKLKQSRLQMNHIVSYVYFCVRDARWDKHFAQFTHDTFKHGRGLHIWITPSNMALVSVVFVQEHASLGSGRFEVARDYKAAA